MVSMENTSHSREECYLRWNFTLDMEWYIRQLYVVFTMSNLMLKIQKQNSRHKKVRREKGQRIMEVWKDRFRKIIRFVHFIFSCLFILSSCKNTLIVGILNPRIWIWNLIDSMLIQWVKDHVHITVHTTKAENYVDVV